MKVAKGVIAAFLMLFMTVPSQAQSDGVQVRYLGEISCGTWPLSSDFNDIEKASTLNWILGFLAAKSFETGTDLLADVDIPSISLWMDNYCRSNPLDTIIKGAIELENEIKLRTAK